MEVEAARTAERRHREATSLLGQPLRRSPSSGQAEPLGANAVAVGRSAPSPTMGQRPSSELGRSPLRSSGGPNFRPPSPSPVVAPLGAAVDGSPPSARSAASQVAGSPSRQGLAMVAENGAGPGQQRARPPPLQIPTYGRQRSTSSGAGSLPSALSAGGRTPLSADDSDDGGDGDGLVIGRRQRRRPQDSASTPPGLSYSPSSSTASHEPSADYLSKLELGPGGGRQASQYRPVPSQHQQRADSPSTPVDGQDFGSSPIDEFGGGSVRSQSRMSRTFGSLNSHGVNVCNLASFLSSRRQLLTTRPRFCRCGPSTRLRRPIRRSLVRRASGRARAGRLARALRPRPRCSREPRSPQRSPRPRSRTSTMSTPSSLSSRLKLASPDPSHFHSSASGVPLSFYHCLSV